MWWNDYVGIPYLDKGRDRNGVDCWGLARLIYKEQFDIELPSFVDEYDVSDSRQARSDLVAQNREGWEQTDIPKPGSIVLFKVLGAESHIGVYLGDDKFIHVRDGSNTLIENIQSVHWRSRLVGFFNYAEKSYAVMQAVPHPLQTKRWTVPVAPGTTVENLSAMVMEKFQISKELSSSIIIILNGRVVERDAYASTVVQDKDILEYRAVPGKDALRMVLLIAVIWVAIQFGPAFAEGIGLGTTKAAAAVGTAIVGTVGQLLIGALMPIRPPVGAGDPGSATPQFLFSGASNQMNKYGAIPVVLGKVRYTAPLGAQNYITSDTDSSYLRMLLTWGFGPLSVTDIHIGANSIDQYENGKGIPVDYVTVNDTIDLTSTERRTQFDRIYGSDVKQVYSGITLAANNTVGEVLGVGVPGPWTEVTIDQDQVTSIDVTLHFPAGLRTLIASGPDAGKIIPKSCGVDIEYRKVDAFNNGLTSWDNSSVIRTPVNTLHIDPARVAVQAETGSGDNTTWVTSYENYYQWNRVVVTTGGVLLVKKGALLSSPTASPSQTLAQQQQQNTYNYASFVQYVGLPDFNSNEIPVMDICMYGTSVHSTDTTARTLAAYADFTYTGFSLSTAAQTTDTWDAQNSTGVLVATGVTLATFTAGTIARNGLVTALPTITFGTDNYVTRKDAFSHTHNIAVPGGRYQVRIRRTDDDATEQGELRHMHTIVLQTVAGTSNISPTKNPPNSRITQTALAIKATDQLNGSIEGVNALVQTICRDWDSTLGKWVVRTTNNPASLLFYILTHPANPRRVKEEDIATKINIAALQDWHQFCSEQNFTFNYVLAQQRSVLDVARDICAAGRASPAMVDGKWTVVIDRARTDIVQHFTPHNSWGFSAVKNLPKMPDALKVIFNNEQKGYQEDELIVYNTGKSEANSELFEQIYLPGTTNNVQAGVHARWHLAQAKLRPEVFKINTDLEYLVCNRGDRVKVLHDVPMWGTASGRIKNRISGTVLELDEEVPLTAGTQYTVRIRSKTGSSVTRTVASVATTGYYTQITLTATTTAAEADSNDLFMFGTLNNEAHDLLVLGVEPYGNQNAVITLVDYASDIYSLNYLNTNFTPPNYNSNITKPPANLVQSIHDKPLITDVVSDETVMEQISPGVFKYNIKVSFSNSAGLPSNVGYCEAQFDDASDTAENWQSTVPVIVSQRSITLGGVQEASSYKIRLRYVGKDGRLGPWTAVATHTVVGKSNPPSAVTSFTATIKDSIISLNWDRCPEVDYASTVIKYYNTAAYPTQTAAQLWAYASTLVPTLFEGSANNWDWVTPETGGYTFLIRHKDTSGNLSTAITSTSVTFVKPDLAAIGVELTNLNVLIPANNDGTSPVLTASGTEVRVYEGTTLLTYDATSTAAGFWKIDSKADSGVVSAASITDSGSYATIGNLQSFSATDTGTVTYTLTGKTVAGNVFTKAVVQKYVKAKAGAAGSSGTSGVSAVLTNDSFSIPTASDGTSPVFTGSGTDIYVYEGATQLTYNGVGTTNGTWTVSKVDSSVTSGTFSTQGLAARLSNLTAIAADIGLITFTITGKSSAGTSFTVTKVQSFNKSKAGVVGSNPIIYDIVLSSPVITKTAPDAATTGAHSSITIQGQKYDGSTTTNFGWVTTALAGGAESARTNTAGAPLTFSPSDNSTTSSFVIKLYDTGPTGGNLLDTQTVPVVFKGNTGTRSTIISAFKWSSTAITSAPAQALTYTWSGGGVNNYPAGWTRTAPAGANTESLYQLELTITDSTGTATQTTTDWGNAKVNIVGYRGDGTAGTAGQSHRTAYIVTTSATLPTVTGVSGDAAPTGWSFTAPSTALTAGQYLYQVDGTYTAGGNIAWNNPYLSNLKVGSLSALAVDTGALTIGNTGSIRNSGNTGYGAAGIFLGYDSTAYKFSIGDGTTNLTWDGTNLSVPAAKITGTLTAGQIAAGAITAGKLQISDTTNLVKNPTFQVGGAGSSEGWILGATGSVVLAKNAAGVPSGAPSEYVLRNPVIANTNTDCAIDTAFDVRPGEVYYLEWYAASDASANRATRLFLQLTDQTGTGYTWPNITATAANNTTWTKYSGTIAIPDTFGYNAGTYVPAKASICFGVIGGAAGAAGNWFYTKIIGRRASTSELIVDGAITANKLSADTVLAEKQITIGTNGKIISTGASYGSSGIFLGYDTSGTAGYKFSIGSGLKYDGSTLTVPAITISADGILSGGGGGQVTRQPIIDGPGGSAVFGARERNDPPIDYAVGRTMQFKYMTAIGLAFVGNGWCTLETNKGYGDNSGVNTVQYAYDSTGKTYKRQAPPTSTSWPNAWTYDLDRNIYTGDLDASSDISLVIPGSYTKNGNTLTKNSTATSEWNDSAYTTQNYVGGAYIEFQHDSSTSVMLGFTRTPNTSNTYTSFDFAIYGAGTSIRAYTMGVHASVTAYPTGIVTVPSGINTLALRYEGSQVYFLVNGTIVWTESAPSGRQYFGTIAINGASEVAKNIRFLPVANTNATRGGNIIDASWWKVGALTGSTSYWGIANSGEGAADSIITATLPDGTSGMVWQGTAGASTGAPGTYGTASGGGWTTISSDSSNAFYPQKDKTYMFVAYIKPVSGTAGQIYLGTTPNAVCTINTTTPWNNPYFAYMDRASNVLGEWVLFVGYVFPAGTTTSPTTSAGAYNCKTGIKYTTSPVATLNNWTWAAGYTGAVHTRVFQYYAEPGSVTQFVWPAVYLCDGSEPSLDDLLSMATISPRNPLTSTNKSNFGYTGDLNATYGAVLGANVSGKITPANATTLIDNDAISSNLIAANAITTGKLLVTGRGKALNDDPTCMDASAWISQGTGTYSIVAEATSPVGTNVIRATGAANFKSRTFGISPSKRYKVSMWCRNPTDGGVVYLRMFCYTDNSGNWATYAVTDLTTGTTFEGVNVGTDWQKLNGYIDTPSNAKIGMIEVHINWGGGSTPVTECADIRVEEYIGGDLIVDGAITASKISTINLSVVNSAARGGRNADAVGITLDAPNNAGGTSAGGRIVVVDGSNNIRVKIGYLL